MQLGICCSPLRLPRADRLARRLAGHLGIATVIVGDEDAPLVERWEQASASDAVLLMLDRKSAPGPVKREEWQSLLAHSGLPPVATLKLEACSYPKLLERSRFFASNGDEREAERWLVGMTGGGVESARILRTEAAGGRAEWWAAVVDSPGVLTVKAGEIDAVQTFACEAGPQFHEVVWMGCEGMPAEALVAEIEFRRGVDGGRRLFVLVHAEVAVAVPAGRDSFVLVEQSPQGVEDGSWIGACRPSGFSGAMVDLMLGQERRHEWEGLVQALTADRRWFRPRVVTAPGGEVCERHLKTLQNLFGAWRRQPGLCRELVGEAVWAVARFGPEADELRLDMALFLLEEKRVAEAVVSLRILAAKEGAFAVQAREELKWLLDEFGSYRRAEPIVVGEQVAFPFPEFFEAEEGVGEGHRRLLEEVIQQAQGGPTLRARRGVQFELFS